MAYRHPAADRSLLIVSAATPATNRIVSVDIFRGITMAGMIYVNDLASMRGMP